jgi:hypothetical protein
MRQLGFGIHRFKGIFGVCMCFVVVGLVTAGLLGCAIAGRAQIKVFRFAPEKLAAGDFARYEMEVSNVTDILVTEGTNVIYSVKGPAVSSYKVAFNGLKTSALQTRGSSTLKTVLTVTNGNDKQTKILEIPFATVLALKTPSIVQTGSDNTSGAGKSYWLPPTSSLASTKFDACDQDTNGPQAPANYPNFPPCPIGCDHCLKPDEAAASGFTQKCSEEPCYYSQDNDQKWYCYSEPKGWCCKVGQAGQVGQVTEATKTQCKEAGGDFWSLDKNEAIQACQVTGYCCRGGQVGGPMTKAECAAAGGSLWSTNQSEVAQACQPLGYYCRDGQVVGPIAQAQAAQMGVTWYPTQASAQQACQPACYCCTRNVPSALSRAPGTATTGTVTQTTPAACARQGGTCYNSMQAANQACGLK